LVILTAAGFTVYYWNDIKPLILPWIDNAQTGLFEHVGFPVTEEMKLTAAIQREFADNPIVSDVILRLVFSIPFLIVLSIFCGIFFSIVRYPFWGRWTVRLEHSAKRHHEITFDWQTDRSRFVGYCFDYVPFFRAIPATPQTHWLLTNRLFSDFNPGWRSPFQVVIITADGSFPFPVAGPEEQEQIIRLLDDFVSNKKI
jgi:hypothetical protein